MTTTSTTKIKNPDIIQSIFSNQNRYKTGKFKGFWKLNN